MDLSLTTFFFFFYHLQLTTFTSYEKSCIDKLLLISMKKMLIVFFGKCVFIFLKNVFKFSQKMLLTFFGKIDNFFIKNNTYIFLGKYDLKISHVNFLLKTCCFLFLFLNIFLIYFKTWSPLYWEMHNFLDACHIFIINLF